MPDLLFSQFRYDREDLSCTCPLPVTYLQQGSVQSAALALSDERGSAADDWSAARWRATRRRRRRPSGQRARMAVGEPGHLASRAAAVASHAAVDGAFASAPNFSLCPSRPASGASDNAVSLSPPPLSRRSPSPPLPLPLLPRCFPSPFASLSAPLCVRHGRLCVRRRASAARHRRPPAGCRRLPSLPWW